MKKMNLFTVNNKLKCNCKQKLQIINTNIKYMDEKIIIKKLQESSDDMLRSLKEDGLTQTEKDEWYGYIRGIRDCAFIIGVLSQTTIQKNLD